MTLKEFKATLEKSPSFQNLEPSIKALILEAREDQRSHYLERFKVSDKKLAEAYKKYKESTEQGILKVKHEATQMKKEQRMNAESESDMADKKAQEALLNQL